MARIQPHFQVAVKFFGGGASSESILGVESQKSPNVENIAKESEKARVMPLQLQRCSSSSCSRHDSKWSTWREEILSLTKANYLSKGKELMACFQQAIQENKDNVYKVIFLFYERAVKDVYSHPIAAILFEHLGQQVDSACDSEDVCSIIHQEVQNGLSSFTNKLSRLEEIEGSDVGVVFLLYLLFRLETFRGRDGSVFKQLLLKVFNSFYLYVLNSRPSLKDCLDDNAVSAMCVLCQVALLDGAFQQEEKLQYSLKFLRQCYIHSKITVLGRLQILHTLEEFQSRKSGLKSSKQNYFKEQYTENCNKKLCLLDKANSVLSGTNGVGLPNEDSISNSDNDVFVSSSKENTQPNSSSHSSTRYRSSYNGDINGRESYSVLSVVSSNKMEESKKPACSKPPSEDNELSCNQTLLEKRTNGMVGNTIDLQSEAEQR